MKRIRFWGLIIILWSFTLIFMNGINFIFKYIDMNNHVYTYLITDVVLIIVLILSNNEKLLRFHVSNLYTNLYYLSIFVVFACLFQILFLIFILEQTRIDWIIEIKKYISILLYCIAVGICEEIISRGIIFNLIFKEYEKQKNGYKIAIISSALIFAFSHVIRFITDRDMYGGLVNVLFSTCMGIVLGYIYYKVKNIWTVVFAHSSFDLIIYSRQYYVKSSYWILDYGLILMILMLIAYSIVIIWDNKKFQCTMHYIIRRIGIVGLLLSWTGITSFWGIAGVVINKIENDDKNVNKKSLITLSKIGILLSLVFYIVLVIYILNLKTFEKHQILRMFTLRS